MDDFAPRRPNQMIDDAAMLGAFLDESLVGYLGMSRDDEPYVVPCNFARDGDRIVIHSSTVGKKVAFLEANPRVCLCAVPRAELVAGKATFSFNSVLVYGTAAFIEDREAKRRAYRALIEKYEPILAESLGDACIDTSAVIEITVEKMTGKRGSVDVES